MIVRRISMMRSTVNPADNYVESYAKSSLLLMRHIPDSTDCLCKERKIERGEDGREGREKEKYMEVDEDVATPLDARRRHLHTVSRDGTNN